MITSTKQEFVGHIKSFHLDVVDEEILVSLENDLRKVNRKNKKGSNKAAGTSSAGKKKVGER